MVNVRSNIASRLSMEIGSLSGTIGIGTVTDPYQYAERRFNLTRNCLEVIRGSEMSIHIHTKSDLILRDINIISEMKGLVGMTVTGLDEKISKMTEPGAPMPNVRLKALGEFVSAGIDCYALIGPILGHLEGGEREFANAIASTGVKRAVMDSLNMRPQLSERLNRMGIRGSVTAEMKISQFLRDFGVTVERVF